MLIGAQNREEVRMLILHPTESSLDLLAKEASQRAHWLPSLKVCNTLHSMNKSSRTKISWRKLRNQGGGSSFKTFTIHSALVSIMSLFPPSWVAAKSPSLTANSSFAQELPSCINLHPAKSHLAVLSLAQNPHRPSLNVLRKLHQSWAWSTLLPAMTNTLE